MKTFLWPALGLALLLSLTGCATTGTAQTQDPDTAFRGEVHLTVYGLSCPLCASNLFDVLDRVDGVTESWGDLDTGLIHVRIAEGREVRYAPLARAVRDAGFTLQRVEVP